MKFNVLIADDEKNIRDGLARAMRMDGHNAMVAANGQEALDLVQHEEIDLIIADLRMPVLDGEQVLRRITASGPGIPVIILTGHGTVESAVRAMRDGAYDFLTKPVNLDRLSVLVKRALSSRELVMQYRRLQEEIEQRRGISKLIVRSNMMNKILDTVRQVAPTRASVLITGESGVGKERIADAIHQLSNRRDKPFISVHCAALSESLLESELFGHERGAFTGAFARRRGRFEIAHGGTIFLDEIGEIDQSVQVKILRVLQEKRFERVGGEETIEVDVRVISATNRNLNEDIVAGRFREDLFYRLNVLNIHIPPLRERKEDIPLLVAAFVKEFARENEKPVEGIDSKAMKALYNHPWPGNVRELRNCIESAVVMCNTSIIEIRDLSPSIVDRHDNDIIRIPIGINLSEAERRIIRETLIHTNGNKRRAAEMLGITRNTLYRKLEHIEQSVGHIASPNE